MKRLTSLAALALVLIPAAAFAQIGSGGGTNTANTSTLKGIIQWFIDFINTTLVPLAFALAFLLFIFGVFRYFFSSGASADEKRQQGKQFIMWGVIALAVMIAVWGLVNILVKSIPGLEGSARPCLPTFSGECLKGTGSSNTNTNTNSVGTPLNFPNTAQ